MDKSGLTDRQWEQRRPLPPPRKSRTGRPAEDRRGVLDGILWVLRTGSPWRALSERYGSWKTVSSRFYRWQKAGVWNLVLAVLQWGADAEDRLDWTLHVVDSAVVRAHQHAASAKGGIPKTRRSAGAAATTAPRSISGASGATSPGCPS